nr:helix-turn-helix transcriptional regulator [Candidatus Pantoea persica]
MPTIIMDSCNYTRLGLSDYMSCKGGKKKHIFSVPDIDQLQQRCEQLKPSVLFIN